MRSIRVPAEIILTFPAEVKVDQTIIETACFACEQHMNSIGMINYKGAMLQTGTLSFGLRVHLHDPAVLKGEVVHQFPAFETGIKPSPKTLTNEEFLSEPENR